MDLVAVEVDPLCQPAPEGWDGFVARRRLAMRWDSQLLRTASWCAQGASSMVQVCERSSGEPVALFYARHVGLRDPRRFAMPGPVSAVGVTECRIMPMLDAGMVFHDGLDEPGRREACLAFEHAVRGRAGAGRHPLSYRSVPEPLLGSLPADGRRLMRQSSAMVLDNQWSDLAGYLASLPDRWPARLERIYAEVESGDAVRFEVVDEVDPVQAAWLAETVRRRRRGGPLPFPSPPAGYFARLNQIPDLRYLTYRDRDGRLLAMLTLYDDGHDLYSGFWGYRAEAEGGRRNLYFDVYPRQVELMLRLGRRRLVLGLGMEDQKRTFGARPELRWGLLGLSPAASPTGASGRLPATSTVRGAAGSDPALLRLARRIVVRSTQAGHRGGDPHRRRGLALACPQCGLFSGVRVTRQGAHAARYSCSGCGAVGVAAPGSLRPLAELREEAAQAEREAGLREVLPAAMLAWMRARSRRVPSPQRLEKKVVYQLYRSWDAHLAGAAAQERAKLAVTGEPEPVAGLASFSAVVTAVNGAYYRSDLAMRRLDRRPPSPAALYRRVEQARRWLDRYGGQLCWIRQVPPGGLLAPEPGAVAEAAKALEAGERLDPAACDTVRAALFGLLAGPRFNSLLAAWPGEAVRDALAAYLDSGARPLREETLARLAAPLFTGSGPVEPESR